MSRVNWSVFEGRLVQDFRGDLSIFDFSECADFEVKRCYTLANVPFGCVRGCHAHKNLKQIMVATRGSVDVLLDDGYFKEVVQLRDSSTGLLVSGVVWRELRNFSNGSCLTVFCSESFSESDYIRNYDQFVEFIRD